MSVRRAAPRLFLTAVVAVVARPKLWPVSLVTLWRMAPKRWWGSAPFLPLPDGDFLRFRLVTMYGGDGSGDPKQMGADIVAWLDWCRTWKSTTP